ncbi:MAG: stealth conserved region 3 domain-containing protein [Microbacteriaceae bacterium]|nr:stealth conserved region 3 domain-containing protein [Microbacteriaceae bacterium]
MTDKLSPPAVPPAVPPPTDAATPLPIAAPVILAVQPLPNARVMLRDDVLVSKGLFTLVNGTLTPQEAMVEDLLFLRLALIDAGLRFFLVRADDNRPIVVVNWRDRKKLRVSLAAACSREPFYSRVEDRARVAPTLVAEGRLSRDPKARAFTLFRPRIEPLGRLRYGAANGVRVELWQFSDSAIIAPTENALMRTTLPLSEAVEGTIELFGQRWDTLEGMFGQHASDITFDIDIVFSWVDGASIEWQRARAKRMESYVVGEGDSAEARYRQIDELKYALRSVNLFAPWIRTIFVVTDSPVPVWLAEHPRVKIVRSEDFFPDLSVLPTHNSHAIESQLHHIKGLSEHFLYSNDDMFFGRPVSPDMFFSPGGLTKFIEATTRIGLGDSNPERSGFENAARVNRRLLQDRFGRITTRHLEHAATPLRKSVLVELETEFAEDFRRTSASAFRSATDISVTNSLYHYYSLMSGRAVVQTQAKVKYVDTTTYEGLRSLMGLLKRRSHDFFCLNDGSFPEIEANERANAVLEFLQHYFPIAAPWEITGEASPAVVAVAVNA